LHALPVRLVHARPVGKVVDRLAGKLPDNPLVRLKAGRHLGAPPERHKLGLLFKASIPTS
jgi:hypothetical protein